jgi:hypothetical protein
MRGVTPGHMVTWARYEYLRKELEIAHNSGMPPGTDMTGLKETVKNIKEELEGSKSVLAGILPVDKWVPYMDDL